MTAHLAAITVAPEGGVSKKLEGQLKAASPIDDEEEIEVETDDDDEADSDDDEADEPDSDDD